MFTIQNQKTELKCCIDYCENIIASTRELINNYRCGQKAFTFSQAWNIQKNRKGFGRKNWLRSF